MNKMDDNSIMPFGKFKGLKLGNVPASYLLWAHENILTLRLDLRMYIEENMDVLKKTSKSVKLNR